MEDKIGKDYKLSEYQSDSKELVSRIKSQLGSRLFMFMPIRQAQYYRDRLPFGKEVSDKWPELAYDIEEASKCFATQRHTAVVFHLMRVMEVGVHKLADRLNVKLSAQRTWTWGSILDEIDKKLDNIKAKSPKAQDKKRPLEEAASYLHHVKNVWRNQTMHPKETYTEEETERVFANVKQFMQHLVTII